MVNAQTWLDKNYPKAQRNGIKELDISKPWGTSDKKKLTGSLDLTSFTNLEWLNCSGNHLTSLALTNCAKLTELNCYNNKLTNLNLTNCFRLRKVICSANKFTTLEISNRPVLQELACWDNRQLTTLIVTNNPQLNKLDCYRCHLINLTLCDNPSLAQLSCRDNQLTNLDFLTNFNPKSLIYLDVSSNKFAGDLNLFSKFTELGELVLRDNLFSGSLKYLQNLNELKELNISNTNIDSGLEYLPDSLEIYCRETKLFKELERYNGDHQAWKKDKLEKIRLQSEQENRTRKATSSSSTSSVSLTSLSTKEESNSKKSKGVNKNYKSQEAKEQTVIKAQEWLDKEYPKNKRKEIKEIIVRKNYYTSDQKRLNGSLKLTGFANLEKLNCHFNHLVSLALINCVSLKELHCSKNNLTSLILTNCPQLGEINCWNNKFTNLNISNQPVLRELDCPDNEQLTTLIVTNNPSLTRLVCDNCKLTNLTLTNNPNLEILACYNNQLTDLDFLTELNPVALNRLIINGNKFGGDLSPFSKFTHLEELNLNNNFFTGSLSPLQSCRKLKYLWVENTLVDSDLKYLPESVEEIVCSEQFSQELKNYKFWLASTLYKTISLIIKPFAGESIANLYYFDKYSYQSWRRDYVNRLLKTVQETIEKLENKITDLSLIITQQKDQTNKTFLPFFTNKEEVLIQKIIDAYRLLAETKKEKLPFLELEKEKVKIISEVINKVGEEKGEKLQLFLIDFESIIQKEIELEDERLKKEMIEKEKEYLTSIVDNNYLGNIITFTHKNNNYLFTGDSITNRGRVKNNTYRQFLESRVEIPPKN